MNINELLNRGSISVVDDARFQYHVGVLRLFGKNYKAHMQATYIPDDNWCVWFPKLYPNGDWDNKLLDNGNVIIMERKHEGVLEEKTMIFPDDQPGQRIIFAHIKDHATDEKFYKFIGVFTELNGSFQKASCSRIATTLYFDGKGRFDINPIQNKNKENDEDEEGQRKLQQTDEHIAVILPIIRE
jgi:hypothetical protein